MVFAYSAASWGNEEIFQLEQLAVGAQLPRLLRPRYGPQSAGDTFAATEAAARAAFRRERRRAPGGEAKPPRLRRVLNDERRIDGKSSMQHAD